MARSETTETLTNEPLIDDGESYSLFQCCVCLDVLYKPIVLACGHISCFWCVHKAMHVLRASHCALCRQPYNHFPGICLQLHHLLSKMEPVAYKRRESEVLEEEKRHDVFSPQLGDPLILEDHSGTPEEIPRSSKDLSPRRTLSTEKSSPAENGLDNWKGKKVSVDDVLCAICKELLFRPAVLNCGHVFCESCLSDQLNEQLSCPVCQSVHPGEFPNVCLIFDHFLKERFLEEYVLRKERSQLKRVERRHGESSSSVLHQKKRTESPYSKDDHFLLEEDLHNVHVGVGCDSCGVYPLIGKRYKCIDCKEAIGFDLCEECYNSSSKLPGRFNQQHTPDHKFEIDESQMLCKILFRSLAVEDPDQLDMPPVHVPDDFPEDHDPFFDDSSYME